MRSRRALIATVVTASAVLWLPVTAAPRDQHHAQQQKADVTGKWLFTVTTDAGSGTPTVTFTQTGDSLTGHYSSQMLGEADFKGTVKEQKITFAFRVEVQGTTLTVTYSGTLEGADSMKGTVEFSGMGSGTFTAKRQRADAGAIERASG